MTTATLPLFPLELVCFPGEILALHIFEDRYQQLIKDCEQQKITFGIPAYINAEMEYGTEVHLEKIVKRFWSLRCFMSWQSNFQVGEILFHTRFKVVCWGRCDFSKFLRRWGRAICATVYGFAFRILRIIRAQNTGARS